MIHTLDRLFGARKFDLSVTLGALAPLDKVERAMGKTPGVRAWEGWITTEGTLPEAAPKAGSPAARPGGEATESSGGHGSGGHGGGPPAGDRFLVLALPADTSLLRLDVTGRALVPTTPTRSS